MLTLTEAARECGLSRSTLWRAIKAGKISATKNEEGEFRIDPAELARVYPNRPEEPPRLPGDPGEIELTHAREKMEMLQGRVEELKADLRRERDVGDAWRKQAERLLMVDQRGSVGDLDAAHARGVQEGQRQAETRLRAEALDAAREAVASELENARAEGVEEGRAEAQADLEDLLETARENAMHQARMDVQEEMELVRQAAKAEGVKEGRESPHNAPETALNEALAKGRVEGIHATRRALAVPLAALLEASKTAKAQKPKEAVKALRAGAKAVGVVFAQLGRKG